MPVHGGQGTENTVKEKKYLLHIEAIRILAIFFVIFNHTAERGFFLFAMYPNTDIQYWIYMGISVFCKFSVPMFLMISGALLVDKDESIKRVWSQRIFRIFLALLLFSFISYLQTSYQTDKKIDVGEFLKGLYGSDWNFSYWYLYLYIAFLIALPFLRVLCRNLQRVHYYYMIGIALVINGLLPIVQYLLWKGSYSVNSRVIPEWLISDIVLYPCIGYFLEHVNKKDGSTYSRSCIMKLWAVTVVCIGICCVMTNYKVMVTGVCNEGESQTFFASFVLMICITVYVTFQKLFSERQLSDRIKKIIISLGRNSFGIYLVHVIIMKFHEYELFQVIDILREKVHINYMLSTLLYVFLIMMMGYAVSLLLKKIPYLNKIL